jgi:hypothetical protein
MPYEPSKEPSKIGTWIVGILMIWGTFWTFSRHGRKEGEKAAENGVYAMYRGIAALWEGPKWKDDYDSQTDSIGLILSGWNDLTGESDGPKKVILEDIHKWLGSVPEKDRRELKDQTIELALAKVEYNLEHYYSICNRIPLEPVSQFPRIQERVNRFGKVPSFGIAWTNFLLLLDKLDKEIEQNALNKDPLKQSNVDPDVVNEVKQEFENLSDKSKAKILSLVEEVYDISAGNR